MPKLCSRIIHGIIQARSYPFNQQIMFNQYCIRKKGLLNLYGS